MNCDAIAATDDEMKRFWSHVKHSDNGCMDWTGARVRGYGHFGFRGKAVQAHRFVYRSQVGAIPDGYQIDHLCRNPSCVNVAHMEAVTPRVNTLRSTAVTAQLAANPLCKRGHSKAEHMGRRGTCRVCSREVWGPASDARRRPRRKHAIADPAPRNTRTDADVEDDIRALREG